MEGLLSTGPTPSSFTENVDHYQPTVNSIVQIKLRHQESVFPELLRSPSCRQRQSLSRHPGPGAGASAPPGSRKLIPKESIKWGLPVWACCGQHTWQVILAWCQTKVCHHCIYVCTVWVNISYQSIHNSIARINNPWVGTSKSTVFWGPSLPRE